MVRSGSLDKKYAIFNEESTKSYLILYSILFIIMAIPIFMVKIPGWNDYPNHLARMQIIAAVDSEPFLSRYYEIKWNLIPNIGMDLVVPFLSRFFDIYLAGKIFVLMILSLISSGVFAIHYAVFKQYSLSPCFALLFIYNMAFLCGFMNYLLGLGLVLWAFAIWIIFHGKHIIYRILLAFICTFFLFFCHLYAVCLFVFAVGCFELWQFKKERIYNRTKFVTFALILISLCITVLYLLMNSDIIANLSKLYWAPLKTKANGIEWLIGVNHYIKDLLIGAGLAALSIYMLWKGLLRIHPVGWLILIFGIILYVLMPRTIFYSWGADYRLPIAILFIFIGFTDWKLPDANSRMIFVGVVFGVMLIRLTQVGPAWAKYDQVYAEIREGFKSVNPGSIVVSIPYKDPPPWPYKQGRPLNHTICLAVIDRSIFTPQLFTGKSFTLKFRPEYRKLYSHYPGYYQSPRPLFKKLSAVVKAEENLNSDPIQRKNWLRWKKQVDYIFVLYMKENEPHPLPNILKLKYQGEDFRIYKVIKPST